MKIRAGFVSNSSSSSFLIYGVYNPPGLDDIMKVIKALAPSVAIFQMKWQEKWKKYRQDYLDKGDQESADKWFPDISFEEYVENYDESVGYFIEEEFPWVMGDKWKFEFEVHRPYDDVYIGANPTRARDDLTFGQWKANTEAQLKMIFGENIKVGWHDYAWRDG